MEAEDLIEEILMRLPAKSLLRFKTVSKQWLRLITGQRLAILRRLISQVGTFNNPHALFFVVQAPPPCTPYKFIARMRVRGSSGAHQVDQVVSSSPNMRFPHLERQWRIQPILVPLGFGIYCIFDRFSKTEFLWNPTSGQTKLLPKSPNCSFGSIHAHHFGRMFYEDGSYYYTVGRIQASSLAKDCLSVDLYSSKTRAWKTKPYISADLLRRNTGSVNLNGSAHWLMCPYKEEYYIASFDYETEVFRRIRVPLAAEVGCYVDKWPVRLTLYDDKFLCLALQWRVNSKMFIDIWVMREYGVEDSWVKEFTVGPIPRDLQVAGFSNKVRAVFLQKLNQNSTQLCLCDCRSSKIIECGLFNNCFDNMLQIVEEEESLISIP